MGYFKIKIAVTFEGGKRLQRDQCSANLWHLNFCTALVPLQSFSSFKSYSDFNLKIAQKWEILRENNVIFQFSKNWNIYLSMSCLSFFHLFSEFLLKNKAKFDTFSSDFWVSTSLINSLFRYRNPHSASTTQLPSAFGDLSERSMIPK